MSLGLVFSGGGARGAYEVGVVLWIAEHLPALLEEVRVLTGASVGAVNASYLASHGMTSDAVHGLAEIWRNLSLDRVMSLSSRGAVRMLKQRMFGLGRDEAPVGLFNTAPFNQLIVDGVNWEGLKRAVAGPRLDAVAVAATDIGSGTTHVFYDYDEERVAAPRWPDDGSMVGWQGHLTPHHVLASTSLPLLFRPVQIGDLWYCDGGLRQNTPLSPALRLGATKLLALSVKSYRPAMPAPGAFPGMAHLLGKLFNSVFLDRMMFDVDRMRRINDLMMATEQVGGEMLVDQLQNELRKMGRRPYGFVKYVNVRPSTDIGGIAAQVLAHPERLKSRTGRMLKNVLRDRTGVADAASYLLFDGVYASRLMDLGYQDAELQREDLEGLLAEDESPTVH